MASFWGYLIPMLDFGGGCFFVRNCQYTAQHVVKESWETPCCYSIHLEVVHLSNPVVFSDFNDRSAYVPGSKLLIMGMVIPPLIGNPYNGYINPYYWVDDPSTYKSNHTSRPARHPSVHVVHPSFWAGSPKPFDLKSWNFRTLVSFENVCFLFHVTKRSALKMQNPCKQFW